MAQQKFQRARWKAECIKCRCLTVVHLPWAARTRCALCPCPQLSARTDHPARGAAPAEATLLQMVKDRTSVSAWRFQLQLSGQHAPWNNLVRHWDIAEMIQSWLAGNGRHAMPMDTRDFPIQEPATQFTQNFTQQATLSVCASG